MNIAEYERAIKRLFNWMQKVPIWQEHWSDVQQRHLGGIPDAMNVTQKQFDVLLSSLGEELLSAIDPVVAEDFISSRFAPAQTNVIDAYIAAAGWKENAVSRTFLE